MCWLEKNIAKQYADVGFPIKMANKMGIEVVRNLTKNKKVRYRDSCPFIIIDKKIITISTDLEIQQ